MIPMIPWTEYRLSRLMLGTCQFGLPYGIANTAGQPAYEDVRAILACAVEGGVNTLDTAASYGESEAVVGRALRDLKVADRMIVVTKVLAVRPALASGRSAEAIITESVTQSLRRLQLESLPVCMFHLESDFEFMDILVKLKDKGLIRHVGVSAGARPGPAAQMVAAGKVEALQVPANVFDPRHLQSDFLRAVCRRGVGIFVRSVFLQGLLVIPEDKIDPVLSAVLPVRRRIQQVADAAGIGLAELAVRFILSFEGVTCVLTGVESVAQVRQNLAFFANGPLPGDLVQAIIAASVGLPEIVITPPTWPNRLQPKAFRK